MSPQSRPPLTVGEQVRQSTQRDLRDFMLTRFEKVAGGPLDGIEMMSRENFVKAWDEWWGDFEMPNPSEQSTELRTPGRILVAMECPECRELSKASAKVSTVLTDDGNKRTITLKVSSTKVENHVHGQQRLPEDEVGTEPFDLEDIVGDGQEIATGEDETVATAHPYKANRAPMDSEQRCLDCGLPPNDTMHTTQG